MKTPLRLPIVLLALTLAGCASHRREAVAIDTRPTPPAPDTSGAHGAGTAHYAEPGTWSESTKSSVLTRVAADTAAARQSLNRCAGKKLLAEQESTAESTERLLASARSAIASGDLSRAESLARQAKQLASSIGCR